MKNGLVPFLLLMTPTAWSQDLPRVFSIATDSSGQQTRSFIQAQDRLIAEIRSEGAIQPGMIVGDSFKEKMWIFVDPPMNTVLKQIDSEIWLGLFPPNGGVEEVKLGHHEIVP
ncbi:MAG: hypothetical protein ACK5RO_03695 [Pseudobdellovibrionaceae bacterium]